MSSSSALKCKDKLHRLVGWLGVMSGVSFDLQSHITWVECSSSLWRVSPLFSPLFLLYSPRLYWFRSLWFLSSTCWRPADSSDSWWSLETCPTIVRNKPVKKDEAFYRNCRWQIADIILRSWIPNCPKTWTTTETTFTRWPEAERQTNANAALSLLRV